ncbi:MAG: hypothetical protein CL544_11100 [Alcanivorax sp.]|jgi:hypothetical protein|nr:hypothetical protein [Alcanivorax sp.]
MSWIFMINTRFWFESTPAEAGLHSLKAQAYIERAIWKCWRGRVVRPRDNMLTSLVSIIVCLLWEP